MLCANEFSLIASKDLKSWGPHLKRDPRRRNGRQEYDTGKARQEVQGHVLEFTNLEDINPSCWHLCGAPELLTPRMHGEADF